MPEPKVAVPAAAEDDKEPVVTPDEEPEDGEGEGEGDEKSPYQEEMDRIEKEKADLEKKIEDERAEARRISALKDKALEHEKDKTKGTKDEWKRETLGEVDKRLRRDKAETLVEGMTDDPVAQKVILHHFEKLPSELVTGNVREDLVMAQAIANRKRLSTLLNQEQADDAANERSIASMGGGNLPGGSSFSGSLSATARAANRLAQAFSGKDKDKAKKLSERINSRFR
jgi:hypothetical protein